RALRPRRALPGAPRRRRARAREGAAVVQRGRGELRVARPSERAAARRARGLRRVEAQARRARRRRGRAAAAAEGSRDGTAGRATVRGERAMGRSAATIGILWPAAAAVASAQVPPAPPDPAPPDPAGPNGAPPRPPPGPGDRGAPPGPTQPEEPRG